MNVSFIQDRGGIPQIEAFLKRNSVFCLDLETNVVPTFVDRRIRTIQLGTRDEQIVVDMLGFTNETDLNDLIAVLKPAFESKEWLKVGHNLEFEYITLRWCLGIRIFNLYDTQLAEKVLYTGQVNFFTTGFWALDDLVARRLGLHISKEYQKSFDLTTPLSPEQIAYAAMDVRIPLGLKASQSPDLTKANLWKAVKIEFDMIPTSGDIHLNGVKLDLTQWAELVKQNEAKKAEVIAKLDEIFVPLMGRKEVPSADMEKLREQWKGEKDKTLKAEARVRYMTAQKRNTQWKKEGHKYEGDACINYGSSAQLKEALWSLGYTKTKLPNTNDETLKKLAGEAVIDLIRDYRTYDKLLSTYGLEFVKEHINPHTGRVHQRFNQLGAETGRTSSASPNMQNIPKQKAYRNCFVARPGYKLITLDYNGCELRILAEYSQEMVWVNAFKNGWDVHSVCAEMLFGQKWKDATVHVPYDTVNEKNEPIHIPKCAFYYGNREKCKCPGHEEFRNRIKAVNFGLAYGMGPNKLANELGIKESEAKSLLDDFCKAFPVLIRYLDNSGKLAASRLESRTLSQRRRLYTAPTWESAKVSAREKHKCEPNAKQITSAYRGMYNAIERRGKNTPIQGSNSDIVKLALGCGFDSNGKPYLWHRLHEFGAEIINIVHDEVVLEVPEAHAQTVFDIAVECTMRAGAEFVKTVVMTVEGRIADMWKK